MRRNHFGVAGIVNYSLNQPEHGRERHLLHFVRGYALRPDRSLHMQGAGDNLDTAHVFTD